MHILPPIARCMLYDKHILHDHVTQAQQRQMQGLLHEKTFLQQAAEFIDFLARVLGMHVCEGPAVAIITAIATVASL